MTTFVQNYFYIISSFFFLIKIANGELIIVVSERERGVVVIGRGMENCGSRRRKKNPRGRLSTIKLKKIISKSSLTSAVAETTHPGS